MARFAFMTLGHEFFRTMDRTFGNKVARSSQISSQYNAAWFSTGVCTENLNADVVMMKSAEYRV